MPAATPLDARQNAPGSEARQEPAEPAPAAQPADALSAEGLAPQAGPAQVLALQRAAGNAAVAGMIARRRKATQPAQATGPRLRSALDSKVRVTRQGDGYAASLELQGEGKPATVELATYRSKGTTELRALPVYIEDIVSGGQAVVNVRYDPAAVEVQSAPASQEVHGVKVSVHLQPGSPEQLTVASAPGARRVHGGVTIEGREKVTQHASASAVDKIMGSIASAEGGFASTEGSDAGVLTWGQGQWTVTAGELQKVLAFIKDRRRDLFDRYWGAAGLDVAGGDFVYDGKRWPKSKKSMMELFRPSIERISYWAPIFAQAGMDPQIQRLQREYLRAEVHETLGKRIGGHTPESVLDTRGQAFFYSMDKNLPAGAKANFQKALQKVQLPAGDSGVTDEQKAKVSGELGELFRNSSVLAHSNDKHHIIAFWGEGGRAKALAQADAAIAKGGDSTWSVDQWKKHRKAMEERQSRYQKTARDIDQALAHQEVEPDVPAGVFADGDAAAPAPAAQPGGAGEAPAARPGDGQRKGAEEGSGGWFGELIAGAKGMLEAAATAVGLHGVEIEAPVGRGGKNLEHDVAQVRARLAGLGYPAGGSLEELEAAIERYQREVVGFPQPDGRIDPGGKTLKALTDMRRASPAPEAEAPATPAPAAPAGPTETQAAPPTPAAAKPEAAPTGPRAALHDSALEQLVAGTHNAAVDAAARELAKLETDFGHIRHTAHLEEMGERKQLVAGIKSLRAKIEGFDGAGLDPKTAAALKSHFYRAINAVSPFYYQGDNIILEFDRVVRDKSGQPVLDAKTGKERLQHIWNTCNITSLAMALEALGKSPADYKYPQLLDAIADVHVKDVTQRAIDPETGKVGGQKLAGDLSGLRLPDYVAMAAIAWEMDHKPGTPEAINAASNKAFNDAPKNPDLLPSVGKDFGAKVSWGSPKFDEDKKKSKQAHAALEKSGAQHHKASLAHSMARRDLEELQRQLEHAGDAKKRERLEKKIADAEAQLAKSGSLSDAATDAQLPIEQYKRAILAQVGPELDRGHQIIVGQEAHWVRLQTVEEDYVIKDDPGGWNRGNMKITWEEARALGLFKHWLSFS